MLLSPSVDTLSDVTTDSSDWLRIGTWNLEGRWSAEHADVVAELDCDLWLLTEVPTGLQLDGVAVHVGDELMAPGKHWAGVAARRQLSPLPDPHPASAACTVDGLYVCSSILPWPLAGGLWPWGPTDHVGRMKQAVEQIGKALAAQVSIWGGDWNTPLVGSLQGFSRAAQACVIQEVDRLGLQVPTQELPHRNDVHASIDHIAVPEGWGFNFAGGRRVGAALSDHDPYWTELATG